MAAAASAAAGGDGAVGRLLLSGKSLRCFLGLVAAAGPPAAATVPGDAGRTGACAAFAG